MAINYKTADQLPLMEEVTDSTYAIVEENGTLKRVSGSNLGGSGIKTAIIKQEGFDEMLAFLKDETQTKPTITDIVYTCTNMTFDEAYQTMGRGEPLSFLIMYFDSMKCIYEILIGIFAGNLMFGVPAITLAGKKINALYWTADGISTTQPSSGASS